MGRIVRSTVAGVLLAAVHVLSVAAAEVKQQEGVVVSAGLGKLTMNDVEGKPHTYAIDEMVKITVHGKPAKLEDLKLGMRIMVMLDEKSKVLSVSTVDDVKYNGAVPIAARCGPACASSRTG